MAVTFRIIRADLLEMIREEIATRIGRKHKRHHTAMPSGVVLPPDRLPQGQRGVKRRRGVKGQEVPRHGTAIVIEDHRESGLGGRLPLVDQEHIENTVIRLPDRVGSIGFATMQEIDALLVGFRALVG
jgi:hypothetical protein